MDKSSGGYFKGWAIQLKTWGKNNPCEDLSSGQMDNLERIPMWAEEQAGKPKDKQSGWAAISPR